RPLPSGPASNEFAYQTSRSKTQGNAPDGYVATSVPASAAAGTRGVEYGPHGSRHRRRRRGLRPAPAGRKGAGRGDGRPALRADAPGQADLRGSRPVSLPEAELRVP